MSKGCKLLPHVVLIWCAGKKGTPASCPIGLQNWDMWKGAKSLLDLSEEMQTI